MPDPNGQITPEDCIAPKGQYRIMKESMNDGELSIVADIRNESDAKFIFSHLLEEYPDEECVITMYDDHGNEISPQ